MNEITIGNKTYAAIADAEGLGCRFCVGFDDDLLCNDLQPCVASERSDGKEAYFVEQMPPASSLGAAIDALADALNAYYSERRVKR